MRLWRRNLAGAVASSLDLIRIGVPNYQYRTLMYHSVAAHQIKESTSDIYRMDRYRFGDHIDYLVDNFTVGSIDQVGVSLSFDDGFLDSFEVVAPILSARKIPFTVFVSSGHLEVGPPKFLDRKALLELGSIDEVTIGAHGHSHNPLGTMALAEAKDELVRSRGTLEDLLCKPVDVMSFPHGSYNEAIIKLLPGLGYRKGYTSDFGANHDSSHQLKLKRTTIWDGDSVTVLRQKVMGCWDWMRLVRR